MTSLSPLICIAVLAGAANAGDVVGKWYGQAGTELDRQEIGFEIKRDANGALAADLYQPVINFYGLAMDGGVVQEGAHIRIPYLDLAAELRGDRIEGTYFGDISIALERVEKLPSEQPLPALPSFPAPRWSVELGSAIYAPAALLDGRAYVGTEGGRFFAVNTSDGSTAWSFAAGRAIHGEAHAVDDAVYFVCDNGWLFALDRASGRETWRYDLGDARTPRILPYPNPVEYDWDVAAPKPVLADGVLYVGSGDGSLHAVRASSGERVWRAEVGKRIRCDAVVHGDTVFVGTCEGIVAALERASGKELWRREAYAWVGGAPAWIDDRLLVGTRGSLLVALDPATGKTQWRAPFWGSAVESSAVGGGGVFYIGSSDLRRASCMDSKDGRVVWRTDVYGWAWARPALSEKRVYVATCGGSPYVVRHLGGLCELDRASGKLLRRWPAPDAPGGFTHGFTAGPTLANGALVIGDLAGTLRLFAIE